MPTYVYECRKCEKVFEAEQRITEDPLKDCDCGAKNSLRRLIQPVGVLFSGPGFHINDYAASTTKADTPKTETPKTETPAKADSETKTPDTPAKSAPETSPAKGESAS